MMSPYWRNQELQIGEGSFIIDASQSTVDLLRSRDLLDNGLVHLLNGLADILEHSEELSELEFETFAGCLKGFTSYDFFIDLYAHLLAQVGPDGINKNLWRRLAFAERLEWPFHTEALTDMPTTVLEETAQDIWDNYRGMWDMYRDEYFRVPRRKVTETVIKALGNRIDIYGEKNMPPELAFGILIKEGRG